MRPSLGEGPVGVRRRENPIRCGQLVRRAAAVVAAAVQPFMVPADQWCDPRELVRPSEYSFRPVRVKPYLLPLVDAEPSGLLPHRVRDRDPADVVQQRGHLQVARDRVRKAEPLRGTNGQHRNRARMAEEVRALEVGQITEDLGDGPHVGDRHVRVRLHVKDRGARL